MSGRKRVAFFAEDVTLAHAGRAAVLSRMLDREKYEVWLVTSTRYRELLGDVTHFLPLRCMSSEVFLGRLGRGRPIFEAQELAASVEEDRTILRELAPHLVVGDFRVSLSISARSLSIPYLAVTDSYWSPYAERPFPLSDIPLRRIGNRFAEIVFPYVRPFGFALHARPINEIRRQYGLPSVGGDLCLAYTDADHVAYADIPDLIEKPNIPSNHHHIGPVMFEPDAPLPSWWNDVPPRPCVYVGLGTSGNLDVVPKIMSALGQLPVNLFVASAGREEISSSDLRANVFTAKFLPGSLTAARSSLVICNGGSGATQQSLRAGVPVLGLASNMDQLMNMAPLEKRGAGLTIGTWDATVARIRNATRTLLEESCFRENAALLGRKLGRIDVRKAFPKLVSEILTSTALDRSRFNKNGSESRRQYGAS
jgi:UDP:flavonoid glycosyltransferase YjiC (YdhE family)